MRRLPQRGYHPTMPSYNEASRRSETNPSLRYYEHNVRESSPLHSDVPTRLCRGSWQIVPTECAESTRVVVLLYGGYVQRVPWLLPGSSTLSSVDPVGLRSGGGDIERSLGRELLNRSAGRG